MPGRWLDGLAAIPELLTAVVLTPDGLPIESLREDGFGLTLIAAECASLVQVLAPAVTRLKGGTLHRLALTTDRFQLVLFRLPSGVLLAAIAERAADLLTIEHEMAAVALRLDGGEETGTEETRGESSLASA